MSLSTSSTSTAAPHATMEILKHYYIDSVDYASVVRRLMEMPPMETQGEMADRVNALHTDTEKLLDGVGHVLWQDTVSSLQFPRNSSWSCPSCPNSDRSFTP